MQAPIADAAPQRTIRFILGPQRDGNANDEDNILTKAEPEPKRQRVDDPSAVDVRLVELIRDLDQANDDNDKHYGLFVWPSALLLSRFIACESSWLCHDKVVLELGCGTGLPSILAALCGRPKKVYLTDRPDAVDIRRNAETNIRLNRLEGIAEFLPLSWGDMDISDAMIEVFKSVEIVLAADCFYQSEDFEKVIATVSLIFRCSASKSCKFYFTYQLRSIIRSIAPLLSRWGLRARAIDKQEFLRVDDVDGDFSSMYLYEISSKH
ncbi:Methyltransferase-like protein 23 [Phytophthora boehmeriae]|uniref:Methyltransferase-like protein 23 n=1 Tax=Phytophthora boehmeriae TaxID=109152 RepID=A0A8T1WRQ2_9STRA|nr:Methyltransferase-like protein 23 [Phytophthora boehmeriae]